MRKLFFSASAVLALATSAFADDNITTVPAWAKGDKLEPMTNGRVIAQVLLA